FIAIHHLVVDGVSWRILVNDLQDIYQALLSESYVAPTTDRNSFATWAIQLAEYAQSNELIAEYSYWERIKEASSTIPVDYPSGKNMEHNSKKIRLALSSEVTEKFIKEAPKAYKAHINDLFLAALTQAFYSWSGQKELILDLESHGREDLFSTLGIAHTVGWFTSMFPVAFNIGDSNSIEDTIKVVKSQTRLIPKQGIGYGLLKYSSQNQSLSQKMFL